MEDFDFDGLTALLVAGGALFGALAKNIGSWLSRLLSSKKDVALAGMSHDAKMMSTLLDRVSELEKAREQDHGLIRQLLAEIGDLKAEISRLRTELEAKDRELESQRARVHHLEELSRSTLRKVDGWYDDEGNPLDRG